jgi:hypothetical protein
MKKKTKKEYEPKLKILEVNFADMKVGQKMAIGTPDIILELTRKIPEGEKWTMKDLRIALAKKLKADVACPVTTSMFFRIAIEKSSRMVYRKILRHFGELLKSTHLYSKNLALPHRLL